MSSDGKTWMNQRMPISWFKCYFRALPELLQQHGWLFQKHRVCFYTSLASFHHQRLASPESGSSWLLFSCCCSFGQSASSIFNLVWPSRGSQARGQGSCSGSWNTSIYWSFGLEMQKDRQISTTWLHGMQANNMEWTIYTYLSHIQGPLLPKVPDCITYYNHQFTY